jgi:hypothetical protein
MAWELELIVFWYQNWYNLVNIHVPRGEWGSPINDRILKDPVAYKKCIEFGVNFYSGKLFIFAVGGDMETGVPQAICFYTIEDFLRNGLITLFVNSPDAMDPRWNRAVLGRQMGTGLISRLDFKPFLDKERTSLFGNSTLSGDLTEVLVKVKQPATDRQLRVLPKAIGYE